MASHASGHRVVCAITSLPCRAAACLPPISRQPASCSSAPKFLAVVCILMRFSGISWDTNERQRPAGRGFQLDSWETVGRLGLSLWRRVAESNRSRRICNPLHNLFANPPYVLRASSGQLPQKQKRNRCGSVSCAVCSSSRILERQKSLALSTSTLARLRSTN